MTERKTDQAGTPDEVIPTLLSFKVKAAAKLEGGQIGATNANGLAVQVSADSTLKCWGRIEKLADNTSGADGDISVDIKPGYFWVDNAAGADALSRASIGKPAFASDGHTANLTDAGGTRPYMGVHIGMGADYGIATGQVLIAVGSPVGASPYALNPELGSSGSPRARAVLTSLAAYTMVAGVITANANGAIGAQDGVTLAAGDLVVLPPGVAAAAKDEGYYAATAVGGASAKFVLTRVDIWATGSVLKTGAISISVGGEGTTFKNTVWKSLLAADSFTVDTDDPKFFPVEVSGIGVLVAGTFTISTIPIFDANTSVQLSRKVANTSTATTGGYHATSGGADGITPGGIGTAAIIVQACVAAGTINNADISTLRWTVRQQA